MNIKKAIFLIFAALLPSLQAAPLDTNSCEVTAITRGITYVTHDTDFNNLISSGNVVIDFFAGWCGPCGKLSAIIDAVSGDYPSVTFVKVDISANRALASTWGIKSTPTIFFYKDGKLLQKVIGVRPEKDFRAMLNNHYS